MKYQIHRITRQVLDLLRQEIFAVLVVATLSLTLVFVYNYNLTSPSTRLNQPTDNTLSPSTGGVWPDWFGADLATILSPTKLLAEEQFNADTALGDVLFANQPTIKFGSMIKGHNRDNVETWQNESKVKNYGKYLQVLADNQVTIAGVSNGNYSLWVTGRGTITLNGVTFTIRTLNTAKKVVPITHNTLVVKLKSDTQIYTISTLSSDMEIPTTAEIAATPTKILMIPNTSTVTLGITGIAIFRPIVILTDQTGKQIANTSGLLSWSIGDTNIATVTESGIVTAHQIDTTTITVLVNGTSLSASTTLTVKAGELSPLIDVTPKTAELNTATVQEEKTTNPIVNFFNFLFR